MYQRRMRKQKRCRYILKKILKCVIKNVIFDTKYGVQFPPVHTTRINETPSYESIVAAKCVLNGVNIVGNSLYFIEKRNAASSWAHRNRPFFGNIHDMCFYE